MSRSLWPHRLFKWLIAGVCALVLFALVGYLLVPSIAKRQLEAYLSQDLNRHTRIEQIRFDPFRLLLTVENLRIDSLQRDQAGELRCTGVNESPCLFQISRLQARASWQSLKELAPVIRHVAITTPRFHTVRDSKGQYDFQDILDRWQAKPKPKSKPEKDDPNNPLPKFSLANIELLDGQIRFVDQLHKQTHSVEKLAIRIPFLSSLAVHQDVYVQPGVAAVINGSAIDLKGKSKPFSANRESTLHLALSDTPLARYLEYLPTPLPVKVMDGALRLDLDIEFAQPVGGKPSIKVNGSAHLKQPDVRDPSGRPLIKAESVAITGIAARPLGADRASYQVEHVKLIRPVIVVHRLANDAGWFAALQNSKTAGSAEAGGSSGAGSATSSKTNSTTGSTTSRDWRLARLEIEDGVVDYRDEQFKPATLAKKLIRVALSVAGLSSDQSAPIQYTASNDTPEDEFSSVKGDLTIKPLKVAGEASVKRLKPKVLWWIAKPFVNFELSDGLVDSDIRYQVSVIDDVTDVQLSDMKFHLSRLSLRQPDKLEFLRLAQVQSEQGRFDLGKRSIALGTIRSSHANLEVRRDADGKFNLAKLLAQRSVPIIVPGQSTTTVVPGGHRGASTPSPTLSPTPSRADAQWTVELDKLSAENYRLNFKDAIAGKTADASLSGLSIRAEQFSNRPGKPGTIAINSQVNREGQINLAGQVAIEPLDLKLKLEVRKLGLVPLQPYFASYLNATLASGQAMANGELQVHQDKGTPATVRYRGALALSDLNLLDKAGRQEIIRWKSLSAPGLDVVSEPLAIKVGELTLDDFFARVTVQSNGRFNLQDLVGTGSASTDGKSANIDAKNTSKTKGDGKAGTAARTEPARAGNPAERTDPYIDTPASTFAEAAPKRPSAPPRPASADSVLSKLGLGRITLNNGALAFADQTIEPNYRASLAQLNGTVSPITPQQAGDLSLTAKINQSAPIEITGKVNPLTESLFLDMQANAGDIDLPGLSPYSQKYVGYGIERGKLSTRLKYFIQDRQVQAENKIVLDQLTFGNKVESATAIKAPVLFAVSLLKDRDGKIDIELPIGGSLDDPKFSIGPIIWQVLGNLIVKAVSSPFSLIAAAFGGKEEELSKLDFSPGQTKLDEPMQARLQAISKALNERPSLKLDLAGKVDPLRDVEALRTRRIERLVKAEKLKETVASGSDVEAIDKVQIDPADFDRYLRRAFDSAGLEKPKDAQGKDRDPAPEEARSLLMNRIDIGDADLTSLASARARAAIEWLKSQGGVDSERLFLVAPGSNKEREESSASGGVELRLR